MKRIRWRIQPMAFAVILWMLLTDRGGVALMTLTAAILHEAGHILAAVLLRVPLRALRMDLLGARLDVSGRVLSYGEEWILCAAGPLTSLTLAALASLLWGVTPYAVTFSCASLILGLLNLLPIRTFDGGRMLETFLRAYCSERVLRVLMCATTFSFLFLLWAIAVYFLLRANDGVSLLCFSMSLFSRFFDGTEDGCFSNSG
ncbi:MAG: hypothetical protein E7643_06990 [Ruminococcaceae bacterium]|nr:hypothetical protein [Oscillospiraceae bacterium]